MISLLAISLGITLSAATPTGLEEINNRNNPPTSNLNKAQDWEITVDQAKKMVDYRKSCNGPECLSYTKLTKNRIAKREIRAYNDINLINFRIKRIKARYTKDDEERYRQLRGIKEGDPRGNVAGYTTKILRVRTKKHPINMSINNNAPLEFNEFAYYDLESICPPPDPC